MTNIYPLKDEFGLFIEYGETNSFISLIFLDLSRHTLKQLHTLEYPISNIQIFVNRADTTTFLLKGVNNREFSMRICKTVDKTIIIGEMVDIGFRPKCFYDKSVYGLEWYQYREEDSLVSLFFICLVNILDTSNLYLRYRRKGGKSV